MGANRRHLILKEFKPVRENMNPSSIFITLQLILFSGIQKIYLTGFDCNDDGNALGGGKPKKSDYSRLGPAWECINQYLKEYYPSIDIQVVSPKGLKNIIPEYTP